LILYRRGRHVERPILLQGCLTSLGIAAWEHGVGLSRKQTPANGDFQLGQAGMRTWKKDKVIVLADQGDGDKSFVTALNTSNGD